MTGRELILYILANNLEDEPVVKDGKIIGFLTVGEVAEKLNVGTATVYTWITQKRLSYVTIGDQVYIPNDFNSPIGCVVG